MGLFQPYQNSNIYNPWVSFNPKQETIQNQILFNNNNKQLYLAPLALLALLALLAGHYIFAVSMNRTVIGLARSSPPCHFDTLH